jgi:hypothetical protein
MSKPKFLELKTRIESAKVKMDYNISYAYCWEGYVAALLDCGFISVDDHEKLSEIIGAKDPGPALNIFLGK